MNPTPIAIVGLGKIALDQHVPSISNDPRFRLVAVVSSRGATVADLPTFPTQEALFVAMPEVEAVSLCTPPSGRLAFAKTALMAGRHVLIEKPPAATLAEAEAIADLGRRTGRVLFATWHSRFNPAVEAARRLLSGRRLRRLRVDWREDVRRWHPGQEWIWRPGGFGVFDPGINALSIVTAIAPEPLFVTQARLEVAENHDTPIGVELAFGTADPVPDSDLGAVFDWRKEGEQSWNIDVETEDGTRLRLVEGGARLYVDGKETSSGGPGEYPAIYDRFARLLAEGMSDVDLSPLRLVADAFMLGKTKVVPAFAA